MDAGNGAAARPPRATVLFDETELYSLQECKQTQFHTQRTARSSSSWDGRSSSAEPTKTLVLNSSGGRPQGVAAFAQSQRRFVAGESFFNYEALGSLRPELEPVRPASAAFVGLAMNAMCSGFVLTMVSCGFQQLLADYLLIRDDSIDNSIANLVQWAGSLSVFLGFLSDCRPIGDRRRKPYMVIGWLLACFVFVVIAVVDWAGAHTWDALHADASSATTVERVSTYGGALLALTMLATVCLQLMYIASLAMTVEFAQREPLRERGTLQAVYFVLYYGAAAAAHGVATLFVSADESKVSLACVAVILAAVCLVPIPFLVAFLDEPPATTTRRSVRRRLEELWKLCHHNVVGRILVFVVAHYFLISLYDKHAFSAIATWCDVGAAQLPATNAIALAAACLSLTLWMLFLLNASWRRVVGFGSAVYVFGSVWFTAMTVFDVARFDWFYMIALAVLDMPKAWIKLYAVVLATEIADIRREGVTVGLVVAAQSMAGIFAGAISTQVGDWLSFAITSDEVAADSAHTRLRVFSGAIAVFAVSALAVAVVLVLPTQKLDAQQLRAFGGYNRYASYGIAAGFALLFLGCVVMNSIALSR